MECRLAAILAADVVGFSTLSLEWLIEKLPAVKAHEALQQALELDPRAEPSSEQVSWHDGLLPLSPDSGVLKVFRKLCGFSTPEICPRVAFFSSKS